jgi:hypothetical protein
MCGQGGPFQSHHVIYEQHLKERGLPRYHAMNALRVCKGCHEKHHQGRVRIPVRKLHHDNLIYMFDVLGGYAVDYCHRYYDTTELDPRFEELAKPFRKAA